MYMYVYVVFCTFAWLSYDSCCFAAGQVLLMYICYNFYTPRHRVNIIFVHK